MYYIMFKIPISIRYGLRKTKKDIIKLVGEKTIWPGQTREFQIA